MFFTMKLIRSLWVVAWIALASSLFGQAPQLDFTLRYNAALSRYEAYVRPTLTQPVFNWGPSQISIVAPASVPNTAFTVTSVAAGAWVDNSQIFAPAAAPGSDFHGVGSLGAQTPMTANVEQLIFHFVLSPAGCTPGLRLFVNGVDPNSGAAGMQGSDFTNTVTAIVPGVPQGYEAYQSNYNNTGTTCCPTFAAAPPNVTIVNSTCNASCVVGGGLISAPTGTPCPVGSTLQYSVNGGAWSTTLPVYAQGGPAQTITTRCSCDADPTVTSQTAAPVTTAPGLCSPVTAFNVAGGGARCSTDGGLVITLSNSQIGINYQLLLNGSPVGTAVAGTGAALSFPAQTAAGTYTVTAASATGTCTGVMNGSAVITVTNCTIAVTDPCVCKNNATTLADGQFGEVITITAPGTQTWTVTAVSGYYQNSSPAPPAAPISVAIGTVLTNIGGNQFRISGVHVDAVGYTISVSNGLGTVLNIGNSCQYPNPSFASNLDVPFCLYSTPVILAGNPGDASVTSQTFTVNGTTTTTFDPGAGIGQYTIVYTVNGGTPKANGPNDPGCTQSISKIVNVIATPATLTCNDLVYISLDVDCVTEILPDQILEGTYGCDDDYLVELDKTAPYGNGPWVPGIVGVADLGQTYQVRITHLVSGNKCWGNVKIEDKLAPVLTCTDINLSCPITTYDPAYLSNTLHIANAYPAVTECSQYTRTYVDTWHDVACGQGFNGVQDLSAYTERKWTVTDAWNNTATCVQYIYFHRVHVGDIDFPADVTINCGDNVNTDPSVTGTPYYTDFGINWNLFPDPGFCELQTAYTDQVLPVCDGSYKILRTWTLVDWCLPTTPFPPLQNPQYYIQLIKVLDSQGPAMACPANLTVSTDPYNCCATTNLPDVVIEDNCSRINNIGAMVTTFDPYTGDQTGMYTVGGSLTTFAGNNYWDLDTLGSWGTTPCLPIGRHTVVYTAEDDCGNTATCSFKLSVVDFQPPIAACDQYTVVSIGTDDPADCYSPANGCDGAGVTWVKAKTFDDGSTDNCNALHFTVRRMDPFSDCINGLEDCEKPNATEERDSIKFYCCEVGTTQTVILRVYQVDVDGAIMNGPDGNPLYNECMVNVEVQDKIKPGCQPPANVTVACENFDASLWVYGKATVYDNCCLDTTKVYQGQCGLSHSANYSLFDTVCNKGTITRTFKAYDCHGLTSQCTQRVVVQYNQDYYVKFPNDVIVTVCDGTGTYGEPSFFGEDCELLGVSFEDQVFTVVPDACFKIERVWTIINWCTYNPNLPCIDVPNPNPNPISNNPANLPGPIVSRAGTLAPWAPTVVKINPTDAQATNYSTFWNKDANCYRYKQIIKVIDTQDPVVENCPASPVTFCDVTPNDPLLWNESYWWDNVIGQHDLCEGPSDLTITATDACSGSNINVRYLLFLDLDNDGTMETVINSVNTGIAGLGWNAVPFGNGANANYTGGTIRAFDGRPVPFNQKYGFAIQTTTSGTKKTASVRWNTQQSQNNFTIPELPYGTHKIKWFVEDGCGNESICEYTFIVKDCKKPTVVCFNGLSVNIMPTQMIQMWASDFLKYTEDNCTPSNQLKIGIRKSGTGTGFPVDGNGNPITNVTFTCDELGTQTVELWSIDKAGNADFCETYVIVQDNNGFCPNQNAAKVAGKLATEAVNGLEEAAVEIAGSSNAVPSFNFNTMSSNTGGYNFNAIPLASNSTVTPAKDDNPLNGVSTYDLVLISKHILGIEPLNSPYKMIAADANKSGSITTFDIVELRKLILGIYSELPTNTSWRFVDKSFAFPNTANPFQTQFPETRLIQNLLTDKVEEDFVSVKVGDVNGTAIANSLMSSDDRSAGTLLFDLNDRSVRAGETFTVQMTPAQASQGYQFTLNTNGLEVVDIAGLKGENYAVFAGATTFSVDGDEAQSVVTLTLKATKAGKLSELLSISSRITKAESYSNGTRMDVAFRFNKGGVQTISGVGFELYQNQPNPFVDKTSIGFYLPSLPAEARSAKEGVTLTIYDETGRLIYTQKGDFAKGYNSFTIEKALLSTTGMLYYKVETATDSGVKQMIQVK
jgi:hypothetical protein